MMEQHLTIVTGHYGSGKTEFAVNLAFRLAKAGNRVTLADLDIVNPYFCSRERKDILAAAGIRVIASSAGGADMPAVNPDVYALLEEGVCGIMDVGGDAAGAHVLGRFSQKIAQIEHELLCVVNFNRPETSTVAKAEQYLRQIEFSARLKVTGLVNNTHLDRYTTTHDILRGVALSQELSEATGIPVKYHAYEERFSGKVELPPQTRFEMRLYMRKPWDSENESEKE
jgi:hypothetical protein